MTIVSKTNNAKWLHLLIFTSVDVDGATLVLLLFASFRLCLVYCRRRHHRRRRYNGTKRHWRKKSRCSDTMSARFDDHQFGERCPISGGRGTYHYTLILFHSFSLSLSHIALSDWHRCAATIECHLLKLLVALVSCAFRC